MSHARDAHPEADASRVGNADGSAVVRHDVAVVELAVGQVEERAPHLVGRDARLLQAQFPPTPSAILVSPASQSGARYLCGGGDLIHWI